MHDPERRRATDDCDEALQRLAVRLTELCQEGEAMRVGEMDGFVTGLLVCAQIVPPSEWLPVVWGPETEFESAMGLRPETWEQIKRNDEQDVTEAVEVIHTLYAAANGTSELAEKGLDLLVSMAPTLIGGMVRDLDARKHSRGPGAG